MATTTCVMEMIEVFEKKFQTVLALKNAVARLNVFTGTQISFLKPKQFQAVNKAQIGDCFVSLKTGYGKSLIFELLTFMLNSVIVIVLPTGCNRESACEEV